MRHFILLISIIICFTNCDQIPGRQKDTLKNDSPNLKAEEVTSDCLPIGNYLVSVHKSYFFELPDSRSKTKKYLSNDNLVEVYKITGDFAYAEYTPSAENHIKGWLLLRELKQIFFTPPGVVK